MVGVTHPPQPTAPFYSRRLEKDDVNSLSSSSDICFIILQVRQYVVPISEDTAGWYEAVYGVADCSHQDPELVPTVDIFLRINHGWYRTP